MCPCSCVRLNAMCMLEGMCESAWVEEAGGGWGDGGVWSEEVQCDIGMGKSTRMQSQWRSAKNQKALKCQKYLLFCHQRQIFTCFF